MKNFLILFLLFPILCSVSQCDEDDWTKALITGGGELSCRVGNSYCERNANSKCSMSYYLYVNYGYYSFGANIPVIVNDGAESYKSYIKFTLVGEGELETGKKYYIDRWDRAPGRKDYPVRYACLGDLNSRSGWILFREIKEVDGRVDISGEFEFTVADGDELLQVTEGKFEVPGYIEMYEGEPAWL